MVIFYELRSTLNYLNCPFNLFVDRKDDKNVAYVYHAYISNQMMEMSSRETQGWESIL